MVGVADGIPELTWLKFGRGAADASGRSLFQVSEGYSPTSPFLESFNGHPLRRGCRSGHTRVPSLPLLFLFSLGSGPTHASSLHLPGLVLVAHKQAGPVEGLRGLPARPRGTYAQSAPVQDFLLQERRRGLSGQTCLLGLVP